MKLYKYRTANKNTFVSLSLGISYYPHARELNDPCDSQMHVVKPTDEKQINALALMFFAEALPPGVTVDERGSRGDFESIFHAIADKKIEDFGARGIFSLSEASDHHLMWSHYGDSHKGICVEFDVDPSAHDFLGPVKYTDDETPVSLIEIVENRNKAIGTFYFNKTTHWKYEREWRLLTVCGGTLGADVLRVSGLILGARTSDIDSLFVSVIATTRSIPLYKSSISQDRKVTIYRVDSREVTGECAIRLGIAAQQDVQADLP